MTVCTQEKKKKPTIYFITFNCYNFTILLVCDSIRFKQNKKKSKKGFILSLVRRSKIVVAHSNNNNNKCVNNKRVTEAF